MMLKSKVKYIQSLSHKKQRDEDRVFVAEGPKIINELLNEKFVTALEVFALPSWSNENRNRLDITVHEIDEVTLSRISSLSTPNQVVGLFRMPELPALRVENKLTILLNTIQDPGNLGTIVRCADWFGISQVVCSPDCADIYSAKVVQSSMGSIARVKVYYQELSEVILKNSSIPVYAASLAGAPIDLIKGLNEGMLLIGNESKGISPDLLDLPHKKITIPKKGKAESLNAAVATGIILHVMCG